jgi:hypothetical protein
MISVENISKTFKLYRKPSERLKEIILRQCRHKKFGLMLRFGSYLIITSISE